MIPESSKVYDTKLTDVSGHDLNTQMLMIPGNESMDELDGPQEMDLQI